MQVQHQIPVRSRRGTMKGVQTVFPRGGKRLKEYVVHSQLIPGVLEGHNVIGIAGNAFGVFSHGKHVLAQVKDRHLLMMRMFGERIQDAFVVAPLIHQIVQDQDFTPAGKPLHQLLVIGNPFVKLDPAIFHGLKSILPSSVTVMNGRGRVVEQLRVVQQQFFGEHGFATPRGSHYQNTGRGVKTERSSQHDCPPHTHTQMTRVGFRYTPFYFIF